MAEFYMVEAEISFTESLEDVMMVRLRFIMTLCYSSLPESTLLGELGMAKRVSGIFMS